MNAKELCEKYGWHWKKMGFASWNQKVSAEDQKRIRETAVEFRLVLVKFTRQQRNPR